MIWLIIPLTFISSLLTIFLTIFLYASKQDNQLIIWPDYFDNSVSKSHGRRVPKKLAVNNPTVEQIAKAAKKLKLNPKIEQKKAYPCRWWRTTGRVLVNPKARKTKIIRQIAIVMKKQKK